LHELAARGVGRLLIEGGGTLARAFLAEGLVDEFHPFRSEKPAGGRPLELDLPREWRLRAQAAFPGGTWETWR
jgi:diaminohydroxyphosphoribosylaminopyrimidine deaminase/5-amino-6-(5-phosphoribosylamino)uracil reductase